MQLLRATICSLSSAVSSELRLAFAGASPALPLLQSLASPTIQRTMANVVRESFQPSGRLYVSTSSSTILSGDSGLLASSWQSPRIFSSWQTRATALLPRRCLTLRIAVIGASVSRNDVPLMETLLGVRSGCGFELV